MEKKHMVYIHKRKTDGTVFYVGMGKGQRPYVTSGRNPHWKNVAAKHGFDVEVVFHDMSEACCKTIERILIRMIGLHNLCNITSGGEGKSGWNPSKETLMKQSISMKRAWSSGKFDKVWNDERKRKCSDHMTGERNPMFGRKITEKHKAKISASLSGDKHPLYVKSPKQETKRKISASLTGRRLKNEHKKAISKGQKGKKQSAETIKKRTDKTENKTVFEFFHIDGECFKGTMRSFSTKFSLDRSHVTKLVNGKLKSCKGWQVR